MRKNQARPWVDFKTLREQVTLQQVLEHFDLLKTLRGTGDQRQGPCPIHESDSPQSMPFSVNLAKNAWHCFSCGAKGNQLDFWAAYRKLQLRAAAVEMAEAFGVATARPTAAGGGELKSPKARRAATPAAEPAAAPEPAGPAVNVPLTFQLKLDAEHDTVHAWGLRPETIAEFGIGYCSRGILKERVALPIHNADGAIVAYAGRATTQAQVAEKGKWTLPAGFHKSLVVFNLHRAKAHCTERPVIVVEGFRACIVLHERGYANTVALLGNTITPAQVALLTEHIGSGRAVVMLDGNKAGREATPAVVAALAQRLWVRSVLLENDRQPDDLSPDALQAQLGPLLR